MIALSALINRFILSFLFKMHRVCLSKLIFAFKNKPKCYWSKARERGYHQNVIIDMGWNYINSSSWTSLGSRLKFVLHCTTHSKIFEKSWFILILLLVTSSMRENEEVPSITLPGQSIYFWLPQPEPLRAALTIQWNYTSSSFPFFFPRSLISLTIFLTIIFLFEINQF